MRSILSLSNLGKAILAAVCVVLFAPASGTAQRPAPQVQTLTGTITKVDPASKTITVTAGKKVMELKRSDFELVSLGREGRFSNSNLDDAQLLKLSVKIEITTEEDASGKKKRKLKIEIVRT